MEDVGRECEDRWDGRIRRRERQVKSQDSRLVGTYREPLASGAVVRSETIPERTKSTPLHSEGSSGESERYMPSGQACSRAALRPISHG